MLVVVPQSLVNYIVERMQEGHNLKTIKTYLVQYGYASNSVNAAVSYINRRKTIKTSKPTFKKQSLVVGSIAMIVLIVGISFFFHSIQDSY